MGVVPLSRSPEPLQIIKLACSCREDVYDKIDVIEQNPLAFGIALNMQRPDALPLEYFFDIICDGLNMPGRCAGAN